MFIKNFQFLIFGIHLFFNCAVLINSGPSFKSGYSLRSARTNKHTLSIDEILQLHNVENMEIAIRTNPAVFSSFTDHPLKQYKNIYNPVIKRILYNRWIKKDQALNDRVIDNILQSYNNFFSWCEQNPEQFAELINKKIIKEGCYDFLALLCIGHSKLFCSYYNTAQKGQSSTRCDFENNILPEIFCQALKFDGFLKFLGFKTLIFSKKIKYFEEFFEKIHKSIYQNAFNQIAEHSPKAFFLLWNWFEKQTDYDQYKPHFIDALTYLHYAKFENNTHAIFQQWLSDSNHKELFEQMLKLPYGMGSQYGSEAFHIYAQKHPQDAFDGIVARGTDLFWDNMIDQFINADREHNNNINKFFQTKNPNLWYNLMAANRTAFQKFFNWLEIKRPEEARKFWQKTESLLPRINSAVVLS